MAVVDREFRYNSIPLFWDDMIAAGLVVPDPEPTVNGSYLAVDNPGPPGQYYEAHYKLFTLFTATDDLDPPTLEDRGLHINLRINGPRANAISALMDNFYRQANPAVDVETPVSVSDYWGLTTESVPSPSGKHIRKGTAITNGTMYDIKGSGQPSDKNSEYYRRKRTFGAK